MIRVLLVDDQSLLRMGFRLILEAEPDIEVAGEAADGATGVSMAAAVHPDVVLMDVRMPGLDGIAATAAITATGTASRVLILTTFDLDQYVFAGLKAGASGFLLKDAPPAELLSAVRTVAAGDAVLAPSTTRRLIDQFAPVLPDPGRQQDQDAVLRELTDRERTVFAELAAGRSNREIATARRAGLRIRPDHPGRLTPGARYGQHVACVTIPPSPQSDVDTLSKIRVAFF